MTDSPEMMSFRASPTSSRTNFNRLEFVALLEEVKARNVAVICVKDTSKKILVTFGHDERLPAGGVSSTPEE